MTMTDMDAALTLKLIGPGISEALTTTIFGLAAAIPAVIAYNHLGNRVAVFRMEMEDFALRLLAILEKNIIARTAKSAEAGDRSMDEPQLSMPHEVNVE
jgi:biopolymer transport protein TolQ